MQSRLLPLLAVALGLLLGLWVLLAPAESRLGNVVKLVYVHGALVWTGLLIFTLAGLLGLVTLLVRHVARSPRQSAVWLDGTRAAGLAAVTVWVVYVLSSMAVTGLTWGQWIAWNEPRVRATGLILVAAIALLIVERLVNHPDLTALANLSMGIVPWIVVSQAEAIRHPVNPIGGSTSTAIQSYYLLIVVTILGLALTLVAWLWARANLKREER